jgi:Tfp pilus assembly protein PilE
MRLRTGFTLTEAVFAMFIIAVMCTAAVFLTYEPDGNSIVRREADDAAAWLSDRMTRAQVEECNFKIRMSECSKRNAEIRITWQGGTLNEKNESYRSSEARIFPLTGDLGNTHLYNGEWNTLTPALTLDVKPMPPKKAKTLYIVMSPLGMVDVRDRAD